MIRPDGIRDSFQSCFTAVLVGLVLVAFALPAMAQSGHPSLTGPPPGATPMDQAPAVVDTALAVLEFTSADGVPSAVYAVPDTVLFGEILHLVLDYPDSLVEEAGWRLSQGETWLMPEAGPKPGFLARLLGRGQPLPVEADGLPAHEGRRVVASFRVYRTNPFRVQVGDDLSPVIQVKDRITGTSETAAIRAPRPVGMSPLVVLGLLAALILVLLVAWVFWARGPGREPWQDREIPPPAWLNAAIEMRDLFLEGSLGRGESRVYLDGLAGIARRFLAGRYRINAQDMTGREIVAACSGLGHPITNPGAFARLIDEVDHRRYDPDAPTPGWCREQTVNLFEQMGLVRVIPRYTEVPADLLIEGEKAWTALAREFAGATGRGRVKDPDFGQRGA